MKAKLTRERLYSLQGIVTMGADVYKELDELEAKATQLDRKEQGVGVEVADYSDTVCGYCYRELNTKHESYCSNCGTKLIWPDN